MKLGKHTLYEELGRGGYGMVYRALDKTLEVERAVKVLHPVLAADMDFIERFKREARIAARLEHPHIVPVYEIDEDGGRYYLVMKYMAGGSLKDRLEKEGKLPYEAARKMVGQIGGALDYAHQQGLVHRDVKPGNVLLEENGVARLADFGFAKAMQAASSATLSRSGGIIGTPAYMAPELWDGKGAGLTTDLYSLACVFYEMLVGRALFAGETPSELIKQHIMDRPQYPGKWPAGVPDGVEDILELALAKKPDERYQSLGEFINCLQTLSKESINAVPETRQVETAFDASPVWKKCENCGKIYDASVAKCPYCQMREMVKKDKQIVPPDQSKTTSVNANEQKIKNILPGVALAAIILLVWFYISSNYDGEKRAGQSEPTATREITLTRTTRATKTITPKATNTKVLQSTNIPETMMWKTDGMEMVLVPEGVFQMGSDNGDENEKPVHTVFLDAYWIDRYEVSNAQYEKCMAAGACDIEASAYQVNSKFNGANQPVVGVSWFDAAAYCEWAGKRLPSEAEWEKAARGTSGQKYPWGNNALSGDLANYKGPGDGYEYTAPVGSYPAGVSPYGVFDMAGNVWEWVNDWYGENYYSQSPSSNPQGPSSGVYRVSRGGSWGYSSITLRSSYREKYYPSKEIESNGFRCAVSADQ